MHLLSTFVLWIFIWKKNWIVFFSLLCSFLLCIVYRWILFHFIENNNNNNNGDIVSTFREENCSACLSLLASVSIQVKLHYFSVWNQVNCWKELWRHAEWKIFRSCLNQNLRRKNLFLQHSFYSIWTKIAGIFFFLSLSLSLPL